jgi:hypothetical protein
MMYDMNKPNMTLPTNATSRSVCRAVACVLLSGLPGCSVASITIGGVETGVSGPELTPDSSVIDFGSVAAGMGGTAQVLGLTNTGEESLQILGFSVDDPTAPFTIQNVGTTELAPGESTDIVLGFTPSTPGSYGANLRIASNDAAGLDEVVLVGESADGGLALSPSSHDFGTVTIGCTADVGVNVQNAGGSALTVTDLTIVGAEGELAVVPESALPWTLSAGESRSVNVSYTPTLQHVVFGTLTATSTSTTTPVVTGTYFGSGQSLATASDSYSTADGILDLVVFVDKTQSMQDAGYVTRFRAEMIALYEALVAEHVDFQLAVITDDDGCVNGATNFVTSADNWVQATNALSVMFDSTYYGGELAEQGFSVLYAATKPDATAERACNAGLVRATGGLTLLGVSDEDEQSDGDAGEWVSAFTSLKSDPSRVSLYAITGDLPSGCEAAAAGAVWSTVAQLTGGSVYSICDGDTQWGANLTDMVNASAGLRTSYALSADPDVGTIVVTVDGAPSYDWTYDAASRSVVFTASAPLTWNQTITVDYTIAQNCAD